MIKSKHEDERNLQAILDYIQAVMPGVGAIVMVLDLQTEMVRPTTNLAPDDAIDVAEQCLAHMKASQSKVNPKNTVQ